MKISKLWALYKATPFNGFRVKMQWEKMGTCNRNLFYSNKGKHVSLKETQKNIDEKIFD